MGDLFFLVVIPYLFSRGLGGGGNNEVLVYQEKTHLHPPPAP